MQKKKKKKKNTKEQINKSTNNDVSICFCSERLQQLPSGERSLKEIGIFQSKYQTQNARETPRCNTLGWVMAKYGIGWETRMRKYEIMSKWLHMRKEIQTYTYKRREKELLTECVSHFIITCTLLYRLRDLTTFKLRFIFHPVKAEFRLF